MKKLNEKQIAEILKNKLEGRRLDGRPPVKMIATVQFYKGKKNVPERIAKLIPIMKEKIAVREKQAGESAGKLAKKYGVNPSTIYRIWER